MINTLMYSCNVLNCGGGECVHRLLDQCCPFCKYKMVENTKTGFKFCSNLFFICGYEIDNNPPTLGVLTDLSANGAQL